MNCEKFEVWAENENVCGSCKRLKTAHVDSSTDMEGELRKVFLGAITKAFPNLAGNVPKVLVTPGKTTEYQCNNAMGVAKQLSMLKPPVKMSPQAVAEQITSSIDYSHGVISKAEATKQGFINISVGMPYVEKAIAKLVTEGVRPPVVQKQRVLVDFSSPNIAKKMHVGHLRSTIIGDSICRLLEFCGHDVLRTNHVGDWGTQFGMLIAYLKQVAPDFLTNAPDITDLAGFYKAAKNKFDEDAAFRDESHREVVRLQGGDEVNLAGWKIICDVSRREFSQIYDKLDVHLKEAGESFYNPIIPKVLGILSDNGQVVENEGAKLICSADWKDRKTLGKGEPEKIVLYYLINAKAKGERVSPLLVQAAAEIGAAKQEAGEWLVKVGKDAFTPVAALNNDGADKFVKEIQKILKPMHPLIIQALEAKGLVKGDQISVPLFTIPLIVTKSDGGFSYDTTDMAAAWYRIHEQKADRIVIVTDLGQELHFRMIYRASEDAGWTKRPGLPDVRLDHVGFGVVCGGDGKRYRSRSGDTANLADLLEEGVQRSYDIAVARQKEQQDRFDELKAKGELREEFKPFSDEELRQISETVGIGAIKYCDLRQNRTSDYVFDSEKMCSLEGNTAMSMLYAYARMCSLARKAGITDIESIKDAEIVLEMDCEKKLGICLLKFPSVVEKT
eukprot:gene20718-31924_t